MTHLAYLVAGWGIALVVLGVYGFGLLRRGLLVLLAIWHRRSLPRIWGIP